MRALALAGLLAVVGCGDSATRTSAGGQPKAAAYDTDKIPTLIDHPERLKGQTVRLELELNDPRTLRDRGKTLRDMAGEDVEFFTFAPKQGGRLDILVRMPDSKGDIPAAVYTDKLAVAFVCGEGNRRSGNKAFWVERPSVP